MIDKALMGSMAASYGIGKPIVKGLKFVLSDFPKEIFNKEITCSSLLSFILNTSNIGSCQS